ncbi:MAG: hypothetical protein WBE71_02240, partial [Xanthobacteraceae bacterium]
SYWNNNNNRSLATVQTVSAVAPACRLRLRLLSAITARFLPPGRLRAAVAAVKCSSARDR